MASSSPIARAIPLASIALLFMMMMSLAEAGRSVQTGNANYAEIPDDVADSAAGVSDSKKTKKSVGYYLQVSGDWSADGTSVVLNPTAQKSFTPGADEYYLGLLTNFYWGATGREGPANTPPPSYRWSPFGAPTTNPISRVQTQAYSGGGDNVVKPAIPGAARVLFVLGGDDGKFGLDNGNPGIPLPAQSQAAGRVTTAAVLAGLVNNGWDGIDWDDELTSTAGEGKGFNLVEAANVMRQSAAKHHVWTPIAGSGEDFWQWQNTYTMIQSAGGALGGINIMAYAGGMYNIRTAERFPSLMANLQNIANMIQWIHDAGFDLQKVKLGLSTAIHTACGQPYSCPTKPIIDPNTGAWDDDGKVSYRYWLDLVTGTANPFFKNHEYVKYGGLGGVFVWNADLERPIPVQLRKYIDQRLGTKLVTATAAQTTSGFSSFNKCKIAGCQKCKKKKCVQCMSGMSVTDAGTCAPGAGAPCAKDAKGCPTSPNNDYKINFDAGYASVSCYDFVPGDAGRSKCGNYLGYADVSAGAKINFWAALPLAYWPKAAYGNCENCIKCKSWYQETNTVVDAATGETMCYKIRNKSGKGPTYTIQVGDSCGGNCPDPPGDNQAAATLNPACPEGSAAFDCARWAKAYVENPSLPNVAYNNAGAYRCPNNQECKTATWYDGFYTAGSSVECPPSTKWTDFCGGKYMHFDLMTQLGADKSCNVDPGNPIYELCPGTPENKGHCVVQYERIKCPR